MLVSAGNTVLNHVVPAVHFDGDNDYLLRGADLTGSANSKLGIFSGWFKMDADGGQIDWITNTSNNFQIAKLTDNKFRIFGANPGTVLSATSTGTIVIADGWTHLCAAWDLANGIAQMFINGNDVSPSSPTIVDTAIDYTQADWSICATIAAGLKMDGDVAQLYCNIEETIDLSVGENLRKFINRNSRPVDMGSDGSTPTGTAPRLFFNSATATWHTNDGTGGGFTENGEITDAATSPSD